MKTKITRRNLFRGIALSASFLIIGNVFTYQSGPSTGLTNAPGEGNCTSCHSGSTISSGSTWGNIVLARTAGSLSGFLPNASNAMTLSFSSSSSTTFGFQLCVLPASASSSSASVGSFSIGSSSDVQTTSSSSPSRSYLMHTATGSSASSGSKTWNFNWLTPTGFSGGATFYVVMNETDGDNSSSGDNIYVKTFSTTVLPVRWLDFSSSETEAGVLLNWSTAQEINNERFDIEKSTDGKNFETIGSIKGKGNSEINSYYSFVDGEYANGKVFYRIRQIDFDGKSDVSKIIIHSKMLNGEPKVLNSGSNPTLVFANTEDQHNVKVLGLNGQLVQQFTDITASKLTLSQIPNGLYLIEISSSSGSTWMKKLLVQ